MRRDSLRLLRLRRLDLAHEQQIDSIEAGWHPAPGVRAEQTVPLLIPHRVVQACPPQDPVCGRAVRWIIGGTVGPPVYGFAGYYVFAHGLPALRHLGGVGDLLSGFGYRLDARKDRFRRRCDTVCSPASVEGPSLRLSAVLAPNSMRLGPIGTATAYFIWGGGVSWGSARPANFTWAVGFGGQFNTPLLSGLFAEFQNYGRVGGFFDYWTFNFGYML
jgi:hypothetical protein